MLPVNGQVLYFHLNVLSADGNLVFHFRDIADVVLAEKAVLEEHRKYEFLLSCIPDVVGMIDENRRIFYISPSVLEVKGFAPDDLIGVDYLEFVHHQDKHLFKDAFNDVINGLKEKSTFECRMLTSGDTYRFFEISFIRPSMGALKDFKGLVFGERDITDRKLLEFKYRRLIYTDDVTGLPNKRLFLEKLNTALSVARRHQEFVVLLVIDFKDMRRINEVYGSQVGDLVLRIVGDRLRSSVRDSDIVCRLWSDEFAVAFVGIKDLSKVDYLIERVLTSSLGFVRVGDYNLFVDATVGVAIYPMDGMDPEDLVGKAHMALTEGKKEGARVSFYSKKIEDIVKHREFIRNELLKALENKDFVLYYQPIFSCKEERIVGAEALLRWIHPERGIIPPDDFIPVAEDFGYMESLGLVVFGMAAGQMRKWLSKGFNLRLSINVSYKELQSEGFVALLKSTFKDLPMDMVDIEITERVAFRDKDLVLKVMQALKGLGFSISLDDFGTGYSSLEALVEFPVDRFKIDKNFIMGMLEDEKKKKVVQMSFQMAKALGVGTVAEGVETKEHVEILKKWGCQEMQGFYFAKPMPAEEFEAFYTKYLTKM